MKDKENNATQVCKDAIKLLDVLIEVEWESHIGKSETETNVAHALYSARGVFQDLKERYEREQEGAEIGIGRVMEILNKKGYSAIASEVEAQLKSEGGSDIQGNK